MIEKVSSDKYSQFKMSHNMKFMLNDDKGVLYVHKNYVAEGVEGFSTASSSHVVSYNRRLENISPKIYYLLSCNFLLLFSKKKLPLLLCSTLLSFVRSSSTSAAWNDFVMWKIECYELWYAISFCNFVLFSINILITLKCEIANLKWVIIKKDDCVLVVVERIEFHYNGNDRILIL